MPVCLAGAAMIGATAAATGAAAYMGGKQLYDAHAEQVHHAINRVIANEIRHSGTNITGPGHVQGLTADEHLLHVWNDEPGRTQREVLAVVDAAIARQRGRKAA